MYFSWLRIFSNPLARNETFASGDFGTHGGSRTANLRFKNTRKMLKELELGESNFGCTYLDVQNKERPMFVLPKDLAITLTSGYDVKQLLLLQEEVYGYCILYNVQRIHLDKYNSFIVSYLLNI